MDRSLPNDENNYNHKRLINSIDWISLDVSLFYRLTRQIKIMSRSLKTIDSQKHRYFIVCGILLYESIHRLEFFR